MKLLTISIIVFVTMLVSFGLMYALPKVFAQWQMPRAVLSLGFYEEKDVWNRIRVDEKGRVLCSPAQ